MMPSQSRRKVDQMSFDKQALMSMFLPKVVAVPFEYEDIKTTLYVKELSARQIFDLQDKRKAMDSKLDSNREFTILLFMDALCDEDGNAIFTRQDVEALFDSKVQVFNRMSQLVAQTVGLVDKEKATELGKASSPTTPDESSSSGLH